MPDLIAPDALEAFRAVLSRAAGLQFDDDKGPLLADALTTRMRAVGARDAQAYIRQVDSDQQEVGELARLLSVGETYFLRNRDQFSALRSLLLDRERAGLRFVRMLSAGCASGEEAYSLAIAVLEAVANPGRWTISILGVDINPDAIERAAAATYAPWSLRETPEPVRRAHFREKGNRHALASAAKDMVRFERVNLVSPPEGFWRPESFDIVFCRNVLMYLAPDAARRVVAGIARSLAPEGHLFLGHAENLRGLSQEFRLIHSHGTFYYRRRVDGAGDLDVDGAFAAPLHARTRPTPSAVDAAWYESIERASGRIREISSAANGRRRSSDAAIGGAPGNEPSVAHRTDRVAPPDLALALDLMSRERFAEALRIFDDATDDVLGVEALLVRAVLLANAGDLEGAVGCCDRILGLDGLHAGAHYVTAICREQRGDLDGAVEHSRVAAYLDADFAMPYLLLGRLARRAGEPLTARRELQMALRLLEDEEPERILLFGGGFGRAALEQICLAELAACREQS